MHPVVSNTQTPYLFFLLDGAGVLSRTLRCGESTLVLFVKFECRWNLSPLDLMLAFDGIKRKSGSILLRVRNGSLMLHHLFSAFSEVVTWFSSRERFTLNAVLTDSHMNRAASGQDVPTGPWRRGSLFRATTDAAVSIGQDLRGSQ